MQLHEFVTDIEQQDGKLLYMHYGKGGLLGFEGDELFQKLSYNLAYNYGIICCRLTRIGPFVQRHRLTPTLSYVYTSEDRLKKGLALYFRNQFLMHRNEIEEFAALPVKTTDDNVEYSETLLREVNTAADTRAEKFFENCVDKVEFLRKFDHPILDVYRIVMKGTA